MAVRALACVAPLTNAAERRLAADAGAVAAIAALMERPPAAAASRPVIDDRPEAAAMLLCRLAYQAMPDRSDSSRCNPVAAAIVRAGGVPLAVGLLHDALEGGGGSSAPTQSTTPVCCLFSCCASDEAAARAIRGAGVLPLVVRCLVEAAKDPEPRHAAGLITVAGLLHDLMAVSPADDLPALASQPALLAALAAALGLAARLGAGGAAAGGCCVGKVHCLTGILLAALLELLHGAPSNHAAAVSFARAGGASHLVRAPAAIPTGVAC
jgi:hypothetical protein